MTTRKPLDICVLRLSAIGDTCNIVPVIHQLRNAFPEARITWIIGKTEWSLLQTLPDVEFITVDKQAGRRERRQLVRQLQSRTFDVFLHMHASMRANLISRHVRATRKIGFDRSRARDFQWLFSSETTAPAERAHVVDGFLGFLGSLGITPEPPQWCIPLADDAVEFASRYCEQPTLIISPCSSDRRQNFRNWAAEHYSRIVDDAVRKHGLEVVLTGGQTPVERDYGKNISALATEPVINLIGKTSLPQLLALLTKADVLLCPDSGPAHMANAVGTPVIGLFATSNRWRTGAYNSQRWAVDRYPDALAIYNGKSVAQVRWGQRVRDPRAMELIRPEDVSARLQEFMRYRASLTPPEDY
ncbi:MAG: glycosyltransferase family 9 protein [Gammaproteobacteria bacterium]|nr:glycosyltransferase family 9 protein [Gammaproteobacteria bacterium]